MAKGWTLGGIVRLVVQVGALAVLVGCDEKQPPVPEPASLAPTKGSTAGGDSVAVLGSGFTKGSVVLFDGVPAPDTAVTAKAITVRTPPHEAGLVEVVVLDAVGQEAKVPQKFEYAEPIGEVGNPRLVAAISLSNTSVRVTFSEPVDEGADDPTSYSILQANVNSESGALSVKGVELSEDGTSVTLTTGSQNEVTYDLIANHIFDLEGDPLAPPEAFLNPGKVQFAGTPPTASGTLLDSDEDGIADNVELSGWTVTVRLSNGDFLQSTVTSDPDLADTDGDGLGDGDELLAGSNPRNFDSDGDTVGDLDEIKLWHSNPTSQDTDLDGLTDASDIHFEVSPILADTDGDGMDDRSELFLFNRDPLIANLPRPQVVVGDYALQVAVTSSYTDVDGKVQTTTSNVASTVSQAQTRSTSRSDTRSMESANKDSYSFGAEAGVDGWKFVGKATFSYSTEQSTARGYTSTVEEQTARQSQESFEKSQSDSFAKSELASVTRTIQSAQVLATVNVANAGDVPFTITNLELSLQRQDRTNGGIFTPVATLRPAGDKALALNLGPFDSERGPIHFSNSDIFPNVVLDLIREPQGLVFKVANFDVLDKDGNNFAFSSATISSRTAGLTIDYGDGQVEDYRIATHAKFGKDGRPTGISMKRMLELAGLSVKTNDKALPDPLPSPLPSATSESLGTRRDGGDVERLVRVRGVQNDLSAKKNPDKRFWTILTNNPKLDPDLDFSKVEVRAGDEFLLLYTRDIDEDGLHEMEEALYGSSDRLVDTDGDGLTDIEEVRGGWTVVVKPGTPRKVFSSPARADSDLDGLSDAEEMTLGTDPNRQDTDDDGLNDHAEILETLELPLGEPGTLNRPVLTISPYVTSAILASTDGTVELQAEEDDEQLIDVGSAAGAGDVVIGPGPNGRIDTYPDGSGIEVYGVREAIVAGPWSGGGLPNGASLCQTAIDPQSSDVQVVAPGTTVAEGDICVEAGPPTWNVETPTVYGSSDFIRVGHEGLFSLDPTRPDTDLDGISDGRETVIGTNPNSRDAGTVLDTDGDGLRDAEEDNGWIVCTLALGQTVEVCSPTRKQTNKLFPDTDFDGLPDVIEFALRSDPTSRDTDGDGLSDLEEVDLTNPVIGGARYYDNTGLEVAKARCAAAPTCETLGRSTTSTHVNRADSDRDLRSDFDEVYVAYATSVDGVLVLPAPFASPNDPDSDDDGLNDSQEFALNSNPTAADTDGDLVSDKDDSVVVSGRARSPIYRDRVITIRYTAIGWTNENCDNTSNEEWDWNLGYQDTANFGTATVLYIPAWQHSDSDDSRDTNHDEEVVETIGGSVSFVGRFGESFALRGNVTEDDSGSDDVGTLTWNNSYEVLELQVGTHGVPDVQGATCGGSTRVSATVSAQ